MTKKDVEFMGLGLVKTNLDTFSNVSINYIII